jgi:uncharacterized membrane protein
MQASSHPPGKAQSGRNFDMESLVGYILLIGILLSVALLVVGFIWRWTRVGPLRFEHSLAGMNFFEFILSTLRQTASHAFRPRLFLNMGIGILMLTPFVRVLASVFAQIGSFEAKHSSSNQKTAYPKYCPAAHKIQSPPYSIPKTQLV